MEKQNKKKVKRVVLWILRSVLALVFVLAASGKFDFHGNMATNFENWGYPLWLMIIVGIAEGVGGIALLIPRVTFHGAIALLFVMGGAVATHMMNFASLGFPLFPLGLMVVLGIIIWMLKTDQHA